MKQMIADGTHISNGSIEPTRKRNCCKCKYKVRWFYSKGAFLVLVWNLLVSLSCLSLIQLHVYFNPSKLRGFYSKLLAIPVVMFLVIFPLSGWLADAKFGNYRVGKFALIMLFLGTVINCVLILISHTCPINTVVFKYIWFFLEVSLIGVGSFCYVVSSLQLGLDQMPDASSSSITSYIVWYVFSLSAGFWIVDFFRRVLPHCLELNYPNSVEIQCLLVTLCMSIVLISDFLLAPKWLIVEPNTPQSLKTIYQVLKFAVKHKAPINRSALTYWEEDIPSRIDLGKSRYGGPFSTEQVEDVKTIFRLLVISLSFWVVGLSLFLLPGLRTNIHLSPCTMNILYVLTYDYCFFVIITSLFFEFAIYPFIRNKLPSILKRIGIASFLITAVSLVCLILRAVHYFHTDVSVLEWIASILYSLMQGLLTEILITSILAFVCAQSPYNMRGLLAGYMLFLIGSTLIIGGILSAVTDKYYSNSSLISLSMKTVLGLIGFILHCILAHWYKRRVRDDIYSPHTLVEEVYDRYLTSQNITGRHTTEDS